MNKTSLLLIAIASLHISCCAMNKGTQSTNDRAKERANVASARNDINSGRQVKQQDLNKMNTANKNYFNQANKNLAGKK